MIIKCKMCGGDILFNPGDTYGRCDSCDSVCTIPKIDEEQKVNRYNRANHLRRACEFDKAITAYERILEEDDSDAEAHWGVVLSRYGIEYVEDPATGRRVPTCHRVQVASILADDDYLAALEHAPDEESRRLYEEQAAEIAEIQKGILAISQTEKPYDVFICYKETEENGQRTRDSALAQEIYYGLTEQGYKVFFSRITLEDKLGREYEPYIFAALQSARVMIVVGTKPEHFSAVWVKNEWSRFLALMKTDRKRLLVPCYRDMDPYDLPEELGNLQGQDMSRIGFMQDLLRGVRKVLDAEKEADGAGASEQAGSTEMAKVNSLLGRAFLALEDGDFAQADELSERALDLDYQNARGYLAKLMIERKVRREEDLGKQPEPLETSGSYQKALRFAKPELHDQLTAWNQEIINRNDAEKRKEAIRNYTTLLGGARTAKDCDVLRREIEKLGTTVDVKYVLTQCDAKKEEIQRKAYENATSYEEKHAWDLAIAGFSALGDYRDSREHVQRCQKGKLEDAYNCALDLKEQGSWDEAAEAFRALGDFQDSKELLRQCQTAKMEEAYQTGKLLLTEKCWDEAIGVFRELGDYQDSTSLLQQAAQGKEEEARAAAAREAEQQEMARRQAAQQQEIARRQAAQQQAKKHRRITLTVVAMVLVCALAAGYLFVLKPMLAYNQAKDMLTAGRFDAAQEAFEMLGDYSDSQEMVKETQYQKALYLQGKGDTTAAYPVYQALGGYKDSASRAMQIQADSAFVSGDLASAWNLYSGLDPKYQTHNAEYQTLYEAAVSDMTNGEYDKAIAGFKALGAYSDSPTRVREANYNKADALAKAGQYDEAISLFASLDDYSDSRDRVPPLKYAKASALAETGQYGKAWAGFLALGEYSDSRSRARQLQADQLYAANDLAGAWEIYKSLDEAYRTHSADYQTKYTAAAEAQEKSDFDGAIAAFKALGGYSDSAVRVTQAQADKLYYAGDLAGAWEIYATLDEDYQRHNTDYQAKYQAAAAALVNGNYDEAITGFTVLGSYSDSRTRTEQVQADKLYAAGDLAGAWAIYSTLNESYQTHNVDYQAKYSAAAANLADGEFDKAYDGFIELGDYLDAKTQAASVGSNKAESLFAKEQYEEAATIYASIGNKEKATECNYLYARQLAEQGEYLKAAETYTDIIDHSDSRDLRYMAGLKARQAGNLADAYAILMMDPEYRDAQEAIYQTGVAASGQQMYEVSVPCFTQVGTYKDAAMKLTMDTYAWGNQLFEKGEYDKSADVFAGMGEFSDAPTRANQGRYAAAKELMDDGKYADAKARFLALDGYSDSGTMAKECDYCLSKELYDAENWLSAFSAFEVAKLQGYKDSDDMMNECCLQIATERIAEGNYATALTWLTRAKGYKNCDSLANECRYQIALAQKEKGDYDTAIKGFTEIQAYNDSVDQIKACNYLKGSALEAGGKISRAYEAYIAAADYDGAQEKAQEMACQAGSILVSRGDYPSAIAWYEKAGDYEDAREGILAIGEYYYTTQQYDLAEETFAKVVGTGNAAQRLYELGQYYELVGDNVKAYAAFIKAGDHAEAAAQAAAIADPIYQQAATLMAQKQWEEALTQLVLIPGYSDVDKQTEICNNEITGVAARDAKYSIGNYVTFGTYPQTSAGNDSTPIEWLVLARDGQKALLLSRYGLDVQPDNKEFTDITWEKSTLRTWLNGTFLNKAFTAQEQTGILTTNVDNSSSQGYSSWSTSGGNNTRDKIFLLSYAEANQIFGVTYDNSNNTESRVAPTAYAIKQGASTYGSYKTADGAAAGWWWLRSPGYNQNYAANVNTDGSLSYGNVSLTSGCVRPALWINLESGIFTTKPEQTTTPKPDPGEPKQSSFCNVGDYVTFGSYEQDNNTGNGQEPIEWLVLDYDAANNRALLLSRYGLDALPYNKTI